MRKITEITIEEVIGLLKLIDRYDSKRTYKLKLLPMGNSPEISNLPKWVRVYRDIKTRGICDCPPGEGCGYNDISDKIILNLKDDENVIYFVSGGGVNDKSLELMKNYLIENLEVNLLFYNGRVITIDVPNAVNVNDAFMLTITSVTTPTLVYTATGTTYAVLQVGILTSGDMNGNGYVGETITYTIAVTNTGNFTDTFSVGMANNVWPTTSSASSVILAPGESTTVEVYVVVGVGSSDMAHVTFTSALNSGVTAVVMLNSTSLGEIMQNLFLPLMMKN